MAICGVQYFSVGEAALFDSPRGGTFPRRGPGKSVWSRRLCASVICPNVWRHTHKKS